MRKRLLARTKVEAASLTGGLSCEDSMVEKDGTRIVETAIEARGAERGPTVRNVLIWSVGLVVVAMAIVWFVFFKT
jgi:hypothetical protein